MIRFLLQLVWAGALCWLAYETYQRRSELRRAREIEEALRLTEPIGPEDRDDWGSR